MNLLNNINLILSKKNYVNDILIQQQTDISENINKKNKINNQSFFKLIMIFTYYNQQKSTEILNDLCDTIINDKNLVGGHKIIGLDKDEYDKIITDMTKTKEEFYFNDNKKLFINKQILLGTLPISEFQQKLQDNQIDQDEIDKILTSVDIETYKNIKPNDEINDSNLEMIINLEHKIGIDQIKDDKGDNFINRFYLAQYNNAIKTYNKNPLKVDIKPNVKTLLQNLIDRDLIKLEDFFTAININDDKYSSIRNKVKIKHKIISLQNILYEIISFQNQISPKTFDAIKTKIDSSFGKINDPIMPTDNIINEFVKSIIDSIATENFQRINFVRDVINNLKLQLQYKYEKIDSKFFQDLYVYVTFLNYVTENLIQKKYIDQLGINKFLKTIFVAQYNQLNFDDNNIFPLYKQIYVISTLYVLVYTLRNDQLDTRYIQHIFDNPNKNKNLNIIATFNKLYKILETKSYHNNNELERFLENVNDIIELKNNYYIENANIRKIVIEFTNDNKIIEFTEKKISTSGNFVDLATHSKYMQQIEDEQKLAKIDSSSIENALKLLNYGLLGYNTHILDKYKNNILKQQNLLANQSQYETLMKNIPKNIPQQQRDDIDKLLSKCKEECKFIRRGEKTCYVDIPTGDTKGFDTNDACMKQEYVQSIKKPPIIERHEHIKNLEKDIEKLKPTNTTNINTIFDNYIIIIKNDKKINDSEREQLTKIVNEYKTKYKFMIDVGYFKSSCKIGIPTNPDNSFDTFNDCMKTNNKIQNIFNDIKNKIDSEGKLDNLQKYCKEQKDKIPQEIPKSLHEPIKKYLDNLSQAEFMLIEIPNKPKICGLGILSKESTSYKTLEICQEKNKNKLTSQPNVQPKKYMIIIDPIRGTQCNVGPPTDPKNSFDSMNDCLKLQNIIKLYFTEINKNISKDELNKETIINDAKNKIPPTIPQSLHKQIGKYLDNLKTMGKFIFIKTSNYNFCGFGIPIGEVVGHSTIKECQDANNLVSKQIGQTTTSKPKPWSPSKTKPKGQSTNKPPTKPQIQESIYDNS